MSELRSVLKSTFRTTAYRLGLDIRKVHRIRRRTGLVDLDAAGIPERRINYACGTVLMPAWLNVDQFEAANPAGRYLQVDLLSRHPFMDDVFEFGFAEDFLEHLSQADSIIFLAEAYRTLKPGGVLRLAFPGLEGVLRKHYAVASFANAAAAKDEAYGLHGHLHFYSREEVSLVGAHIGFREIVFSEYRESRHPALRDLDTRIQQRGLNTYVELMK